MVSILNCGLIAAGVVLLFALAAEGLHALRWNRIAPLAFGPRRGPMTVVAIVASVLRAASMASIAFALVVLALLPSHAYKKNEIKEHEYRHLVLLLDVSKSMTLEDAGVNGKLKRNERAADLIESFFERVQAEKYKTTLVAFATDGKVVAKDTTDREVIRHILTEIPLRHAFKPGETNMFAALEEAAKVAKPWPPNSAILMVVTDGDTVPGTGMPKMPASIGNNVVFVGVGNPSVPKAIGSHMSRQDASTLRQTAARLNGTYHDGNDKHLSTSLVSQIDERAGPKGEEGWGLREYALLFLLLGTGVLGLLPVALAIVGMGWSPGRRGANVRNVTREPARAGVGV